MTPKDTSLQDKLEQAKKQANNKQNTSKKSKSSWTKESKLLQEIEKIKQENKELGETCKRAQFDYINLKSDMDIYQRRISEKEKNMQIDTLIDTIKKFLPFIEELRKSLDNIPTDQQDNPLSQGLQLTYNKFTKKLEELHIFAIPSVGESPDSELHEAVSMAPTPDKKLKGKIIQEFERGFIYEKDWLKKVVNPAKVVIWQ